jgi:ribosomal protein S6--L-glutamate ligase/gamma-F420-2:alpha-L-glutamate ligase
MKPVLIIAASQKNLAPFVPLVQDQPKKVSLSTWDQITTSDQAAKVFLDFNGQKIDLADFSLIYFRTVQSQVRNAHLAVNYLKKTSTIIMDEFWLVDQYDADKTLEYFRLISAGLPVPPFVYGSTQLLRREGPKFGFPLILKRSNGSKGEQVFLARNEDQLESYCQDFAQEENHGYFYLAQKFINNDGDFRVFVIGNQALGAIKRTRQNETEFRNNISQGGRAEKVNLPEELIHLAIEAAACCRINIAGVDIILDKDDNNKPYILEVNAAPQFGGFSQATGIDVAQKMIDYLLLQASQSR